MNFMRNALLRTALCALSWGLSGCDEELVLPVSPPSNEAKNAPVAVPDVTPARPIKDVEIEIAGVGVWDGRSTRADIWVAHRDAPKVSSLDTLPWVRISNLDAGRTVIGRLYGRSAEGQGADFLVSAEAASGLGLLAGAPAALEVSGIAPPVSDTEEKIPPPDGVPQKAYVHLAVFREQSLVDEALARLEAQGLPARVIVMEANPPFFKLILGPAKTYGQRAEFLHKSRQLGYSDAYFIALD